MDRTNALVAAQIALAADLSAFREYRMPVTRAAIARSAQSERRNIVALGGVLA